MNKLMRNRRESPSEKPLRGKTRHVSHQHWEHPAVRNPQRSRSETNKRRKAQWMIGAIGMKATS